MTRTVLFQETTLKSVFPSADDKAGQPCSDGLRAESKELERCFEGHTSDFRLFAVISARARKHSIMTVMKIMKSGKNSNFPPQ